MSSKLLAIPGPVELSPRVQAALALPPLSHVSPEFVKVMQETLRMTRQVAKTTTAQAFILAGSGTLGWEQVGANLITPGDRVLVLQTGYFADGFRECLEAYGAVADTIVAPLGGTVSIDEVEAQLKKHTYKMITITHVDTSTGVLSDAQGIANIAHKTSPNTLIALDAVCSLSSEPLAMDAWSIDVVLSASQKGLGAPPGLSILLASPRALAAWEESTTTTRSAAKGGFYASWTKWAPIMRAYDSGKPAYFGTPAVTLLRGLHASLLEIIQTPRGGVDARVEMHRVVSGRVKGAVEAMGLRQVAVEERGRACGMTAVYVPPGMRAGEVVAAMAAQGVVVAGGLVSSIKDSYIRIGHLGYGVTAGHAEMVVAALASAIKQPAAVARL